MLSLQTAALRAVAAMTLALGLMAPALAAEPEPPKPPALELVVLGSGGPGALGRAASCHLIWVDGVPRIMVDAGPGCFVRLGETGLPLAQIGTYLITHLHADHVGDLPGLW